MSTDYYYYGTAGGRRFWWKQHVTTLQISQFVIDLAIVYYASFQLFSHRLHSRYPFLPATKDCAGSENAALFGCGLLTSYLLLFIQFFIATYLSKGKAAKRVAANGHANGNSHANGNGHAKHANGNGVVGTANGVAYGMVKSVNGYSNGNGAA